MQVHLAFIAGSRVQPDASPRRRSKGTRMPIPALLMILASAIQAQAAPEHPIVVTGRGGPPFISPMGEPFRARTTGEDTLADWFRQADRSHDGFLTLDEMQADADRFFAKLDVDHNGDIEPE